MRPSRGEHIKRSRFLNGDSYAMPGRRDYQHDAVGVVAQADNILLANDPAQFFKQAFTAVVDEYSKCISGTTLCAVSVMSLENKGRPDLRITTANIGDSQAHLVLWSRDENSGKMQFEVNELTEPHDFNNEKVLQYVKKQGGTVEVSSGGVLRVNHGLNMGGAIGDYDNAMSIKDRELRDCLYREPDVKTRFLSDFFLEQIPQNAVIILASDGFREGQEPYFIQEAMNEYHKIPQAERMTLSQFLAEFSYRKGSEDNISVIAVNCVENNTIQTFEKPFVASDADGHSKMSRKIIFDPADKKTWDGADVSSAVIEDMQRFARNEKPLPEVAVNREELLSAERRGNYEICIRKIINAVHKDLESGQAMKPEKAAEIKLSLENFFLKNEDLRVSKDNKDHYAEALKTIVSQQVKRDRALPGQLFNNCFLNIIGAVRQRDSHMVEYLFNKVDELLGCEKTDSAASDKPSPSAVVANRQPVEEVSQLAAVGFVEKGLG
jgi:serine/threonine protein phosphatase PrpC